MVTQAELTQIVKAQAMHCRSKLLVNVARDPDPNAKEELQKEFNCLNCDTYKYCCKLDKV